MQKIFIVLLIVGSVLFAGLVFSSANNNDSKSLLESQHSGILSSAEQLTHDWGDINILGGDVSKTFRLTNTENKPLIVLGAVTSCMCTTAEILLDNGDNSGVFGMQGGPDWQYAIQPGESFDVVVTFDPLAHGPTATGPINRTVNVISKPNPEQNGVVYTRIDVRGNVLSEGDFNAKYDS